MLRDHGKLLAKWGESVNMSRVLAANDFTPRRPICLLQRRRTEPYQVSVGEGAIARPLIYDSSLDPTMTTVTMNVKEVSAMKSIRKSIQKHKGKAMSRTGSGGQCNGDETGPLELGGDSGLAGITN